MSISFLHSMIRIKNPETSLHFYVEGLGLELVKKNDYPDGKFSLFFLRAPGDKAMIELTHNWEIADYTNGKNFGHLAFSVQNIYDLCSHLRDNLKVEILRPPRNGRMAFVKDPNGISIELLQKGEALKPIEPWSSMLSKGSW